MSDFADEARSRAAQTRVASAQHTIETEAAGLAALTAALRGPLGVAFDAAIEMIAAARGRVVVTGMGKSGHVGRKIAATLASTGAPAQFVHPAEASHGDLGMITRDDVVLALSWSGETAELRDIVAYSRRFNVPLVAITSNATSALGRAADVVLELPMATEACPLGLAPTTSTLMQLACGDALAVALLESRGFTPHDFKTLHPGGRLGASLMRVRDVMHAGADLPLASVGSPLPAAVTTMTAKSLGCVVIVDVDGALAGIITDGDLRRHLGDDLVRQPVEAVMTRNPRTVRADQLVAAAIEVMNARKITALVVVDGARPVGIVHMHDLLRIGVI